MPSRVIGSTSPAASPASSQRDPATVNSWASRTASDGIGHAYGSSRAPRRDAGRANPLGGPRAESLRGVSRRRLGADADRQVSRARKRPDVAGRIGDELDHDLRARDAVREEAGRDRELIAPERLRDATANEAVGAVGADHDVGPPMTVARFQRHAIRIDAYVGHPRRFQRCARLLRRVKERGVEFRAACDHERTAIEVDGRRFRVVRPMRSGAVLPKRRWRRRGPVPPKRRRREGGRTARCESVSAHTTSRRWRQPPARARGR